MAYTKIHAIKSTVNKAINYICNPDKTDNEILITSYGCSPETAPYDFKFALSKTDQNNPNQAFHLIQSFEPNETDYDEAHAIGIELADRVLGGKFSYIVTTHIDRNHLHNHIIFCAANNLESKKYYDNKTSYRRIRSISDELCAEHGLSVIEPQNSGQHYKEWQAKQRGESWKTKLKKDIDSTVKWANSYEDFIALMQQKGYAIESQELVGSNLKTIKFKAPGQERFIRGSVKSLGENYTREGINERIIENIKIRQENRIKNRKERITNPKSRTALIDVTQEKFANSPGLKRWADLQNLKTAANAYSQVGSMASLETQISAQNNKLKQQRSDLRELESAMKSLSEIIHYANQYAQNKPYQYRYEKSKDKERYYENHEYELAMFQGAKNMLKRLGVDEGNIDLERLRQDYELMKSQHENLARDYKNGQKNLTSLEKKKATIERYAGREDARENENNLLI